MSQHIDAIFINGVFRPEQSVDIADGERVSLTIDAAPSAQNELSDVLDLLDTEFTASCRQAAGSDCSLETIRQLLTSYQGSVADLIDEEREER
jgi:predicted DNA-binding antitoxin AbrB/MazE fold protein